ncbi:MAG TPA: hypothetical protein VGN13_02360 [Solirubrobacteraceae bacterium]|jgi:hypothetical protein
MSDASNVAKSLRERFGGTTEERFGKALSDLLENPILTGALGRAFDAREKAAQAQEVAMGALNIPSAADVERLTRRLRSVSQRLEGIEDGVDRLDRAFSPTGVEARLTVIERQLGTLMDRLASPASSSAGAPRRKAKAGGRARAARTARAPARAKAPGKAKARAAAKPAGTAKPGGKAKAPATAKAAGRAKPGGRAKAARKAKAPGKANPA